MGWAEFRVQVKLEAGYKLETQTFNPLDMDAHIIL